MLKVRVIPTLLLKNYGLVKGIGFDSWRRVGTVLPAINVYNSRDVDELILVDIEASNQKKEFSIDSVNDVADNCFVPLSIGGGINNISGATRLIENGCDKVTINSAIYSNPKLITQLANLFGSQAVVASIDVSYEKNNYTCFSHSGKKNEMQTPLEIAKKVEDLGAGEILLTSINNDGKMEGYDYKLTELISNNVSIPVIASGGAGNSSHMLTAIKECGASAVAAASIFHFTEVTPNDIKEHLRKNKIPVRDSN